MPPAGSRTEFSAALDEARRAQHLSIRQVARIADVPPATAQGWLSGKHFPTPALRPQFLRLVAELGLTEQTPEDLFDGSWTAMQPRLRARTTPYLGLRPFGVADAPYFFGRAAEARRLAARLAAMRLRTPGGILALVGPSGSGKSSLLAAGLVATECVTGELAGWRVETVPVDELPDIDAGDLDLVVIDQFEDALRSPWREACLAALERLCRRTQVVIGLRSDAFAEASRLPVLVDALSAPVLLAPVTRDELREVVIGPAGLAGVAVEDELVQALINDLARSPAGSGEAEAVLPLLSNALLATWAAGSGDRMTVADYYGAGGVSRAVESLAEQVYGSLTAEQQSAAERLFLRLVGVSADAVVREPLPLDAIDEVTYPVMDAFVAARMLTVSGDHVQISHDALLAHWGRLHGWVTARRDDLAVLARLRRAVEVWEDADRDPAALVPVDRLTAVAQWLDDPLRTDLLAPAEREFLDAGERHFASVLDQERRANARLRRQRRLALGLTAIATAFALVAGFAFWRMWESQLAAESARLQAQSRQVAIAARSQRAKDPNLQAQMAVVSAGLADTLDGRSVLLDATAVDFPVQWSGEPSAVLATSGELVVRGAGKGMATRWRSGELMESPGLTWQADPDGAPINALAATTVAGRDLVAVGGAGSRALWDVTGEPALIADLGPGGGSTYAVAFDPSGRLFFGGEGGVIEIWEVNAEPRLAATLLLDENAEGRPRVSSLTVTPSGILHAGGPEDAIARWRLGDDIVRLPDLPTRFNSGGGQLVDVRVLSLAISPDGTRLAAGLAAPGLLQWDLTGEEATGRAPLTTFTSYVNGVGFSADSARLIAASSDQDVTVFDTADDTLVRRMTTPNLANNAAIVEGRPVATGVDGTLRVWPVESPVWRSSGSTIYNMSGSATWLAGGSPYDGIALWRLGDDVVRRMPTPVVGDLPDGDLQQGRPRSRPTRPGWPERRRRDAS